MKKIIAASFLFVFMIGTANAHSGGTDSNGCPCRKEAVSLSCSEEIALYYP